MTNNSEVKINLKTSKIKLAIIENNLVIGGVQKLVIDQLRTLDSSVFDIFLITLTDPKVENFYSQIPGHVNVIKLNLVSFKNIRSILKLHKVLKSISPDIVKSSLYLSNTMSRILKPFIGYKLITAEHNTNDGKKALQRFVNRTLYRLSNTTIVDSVMVAEELSKIDNIPLDHYTVVHNGVDLDAVRSSEQSLVPKRESLRLSYGIQSNETLFLSIGRIVRQKNHIRMVESFSLLLKQRPNCKLMIIGDGGLKQELEKKITELSVDNNIILLSARKDIHQFYIMSDVTLLSSDHEGFCIAAMEGLAFGAPLVSTKVAGVVEYLKDGENGFFAEKTSEDLADKMMKIVDLHPSVLALFQKRSKLTSQEYSLKNYGERIQKLLLKMLDEPERNNGL